MYAATVGLRGFAYDRGWFSSFHAGVPTFCVGGLEVGGTGKTPVARWLLRMLQARGHRPGLLSRGYGRRRRDLVIRRPREAADAEAIGDEPALIARAVDVGVAAFGDRVVAARRLREEVDVDCLVLDDGFAHRRLARDIDIVVLRAGAPLESLRMLPWGTLRERPSALQRADVLWFHDRNSEPRPVSFQQRRWASDSHLVVASSSRLVLPSGLGRQDVLLVTGIARGDRVRRSLAEAGIDVVEHLEFADHHRFNARDEGRIRDRQRAHGGPPVVVTAKDAVKLGRWSLPLSVIDVEVVIDDASEARLYRRLSQAFEDHARHVLPVRRS